MKAGKLGSFFKIYPSSLDASRIASEDLMNYWQAIGVSDELASQLELCVVEMVNNAYLHAYSGEEGLPVEVECAIEKGDHDTLLKLFISDNGSVMSQQELDSKLDSAFIEPDPCDESTWTTSGRGFIIVSSLMDRVQLFSENSKNTFLMVKKLDCEHASA
ncbi:ATP-binding protein [Vibrio sp. LaRot3]|uniref:ATP-binding protein n=1 Tax=Vibrio sp. LaRot3 TaxID=2998829 RepID=UPI0022CDFE90|nr:ATP-binding protein [Vibrio sp. LaRot3]MDA0148135.1 ATP-binding protein [Vibrio sp. LaRot3]